MSSFTSATATTQSPARVDELLNEAHTIRVRDLNQSISLANEALELSRAANNEPYVAKSLAKLSLFYMIIGKNEKSMATAEEAIEIFEKVGDAKGIADAKYSIAGTYYKSDQFHLGLIKLEECLITYRELNDHFNQARVQKSMGTLYEYFGDVNSAIQAYENSIECGRAINDKNLISNAYNPLSGIHLNQGEIEKAQLLIEESISMKKETGDLRGLAFALYGRGKIGIQTKDYQQAEIDFNEAIKIHQSTDERLGMAMCHRKLGVLYFEMDALDLAKEQVLLGLQVAREFNIALIISDLYYLQYQIYKKEENISESLKYLELFCEHKGEILSARSMKMIKSYEVVNRLNNLEQEAKRQQERTAIIEEKNNEMDLFFHRVCHDLRGPAANLLGLEAIYREEIKDEKIREFMDMSKNQVTRINVMLDELIKLTKVTHQNSESKVIDFEQIISSCVESCQMLENFNKIKIGWSIDDSAHLEVPWGLVNAIFQNLIENGIKYARLDQDHPELQLNVSSAEDGIEIVAEDNGIGINMKSGEDIFQMFYRVKSDISGSGLGLYILNRAVERLNGTVDVDSKIGRGSTFTVKIPFG